MQNSLAVRLFLNRTKTNYKHFCFVIRVNGADEICNLSVAEVAGTYTRLGGKLNKIKLDDLARAYAKKMQWELEYFSVADGV